MVTDVSFKHLYLTKNRGAICIYFKDAIFNFSGLLYNIEALLFTSDNVTFV